MIIYYENYITLINDIILYLLSGDCAVIAMIIFRESSMHIVPLYSLLAGL